MNQLIKDIKKRIELFENSVEIMDCSDRPIYRLDLARSYAAPLERGIHELKWVLKQLERLS